VAKQEQKELVPDPFNKNNYKLLGLITVLMIIAFIKGTNVSNPDEFNFGGWSLLPAVVAVVLSFVTRDALFSLLIASISGLMIQGKGLWGLPGLFMKALGSADFIWVVLIEILIGVLVAFFFLTGTTEEFAKIASNKVKSRKGVQLLGWFLGMFIFFSDYFSPLFTGPVMRSLTDNAKISREKLSYICDSTSAPVSVLVPFTAWGVFISGLLIGHGPITDQVIATQVFIKSIGFNFYAILAVSMVGLIATGIIPEFGPMKEAEKRAVEEGKVLSDTAQPLMGAELSNIKKSDKITNPRLLLNFILPVFIIIFVAIGTYIFIGSAKTLEAFMYAVFFLGVILIVQKLTIKEVFDAAVQGIKGVTPAILILAMAFVINTISKELGAAQFVISVTEGWMSASMLPALTFAMAAFISFSTGTSWGTYAIVMPIAVPIALAFSNNSIGLLLFATVGAVAGGGVFGDHCSPLSDTTILSSLGAASDHIDHVKTQLPYASVVAGAALILYLVIGIFK